MLSAQDILARLAVVQGAVEDLECVAKSFGQVRQPLEKEQRGRGWAWRVFVHSCMVAGRDTF